MQIIADQHGNVIALGERDLLGPATPSEADRREPLPVIERRAAQGDLADAVKLTKAADYYNAGTVEFIYDLDRKHTTSSR